MKAKIDYEVFKNGSLSKEQVATWLKQDVEACLVLISALCHEQEAFNALVDVFYSRYEKIHKQEQVTDAINGQKHE